MSKDKWIYSENEELYWEFSDEFDSKENEIFFEWIKKYNYEPYWFEVIDVESVDLSNKQ